jgi:hypothetical protein
MTLCHALTKGQQCILTIDADLVDVLTRYSCAHNRATARHAEYQLTTPVNDIFHANRCESRISDAYHGG